MMLAANESIFHVTLPACSATFNVTSFIGHEAISEWFKFDIQMVSISDDIEPEDMLLQSATLTIVGEDFERHVNGIINRFSKGRSGDKYTEYSFYIVPKLWYLTKRTDCRIFQEQTIPEIIQSVLESAGFKEKDEFIFKLTGKYKPHTYIVQQ
ncbi:contractile injection system protein, VgrG/Pvc8 family [Zooshikella ganghwensis]|uniref:Type VI secretion system tip protein VgrG n=1 Tax=Zooshikella ganghwensis TaxID=202772 RepID=A0A4P9VDS9_9GAMM|nr:contractile injection system protein, VgrG/Pvc8 family [Zooshikella ganghwensis]RDH41223.1 hypothetical protein B9G39_29355 [Zooshikella ganghwensis]